jgi:Uma2 family endonuclease
MQLDNHPEQGEVVAEQWFRLNDDTVRAPDVALIAPSQLPLLEPEHRIQPFSPALAVEITSPPNTFDELARKTQQYLEAGTSAVSILVTATHEILVYRAGAHTTILTAPDLLEDTALLPGFSDPVEELFAV